jgi:flagellar hook-associated protein 3 FlgL
MSMRIATAFAYDQSIFNLQERQQNLSQTQLQLTSGKRVNKASDDPTAAARAERALAASARTDADKRAIDASRNVMQTAESALGDAVELMQSARETLIAAGNGSYTVGEQRALAVKLREIRSQLLSVANRPDGGGGYIFGGQGVSSPPFVESSTGVNYKGQSGELLSSARERLTLTVDGKKSWMSAREGNGVATAEASPTNTGNAQFGVPRITNPASVPYPAATPPGPTFSISFTDTGAGLEYEVFQDGTSLGAPAAFVSGQSITIPGSGLSMTVAGSPADGDSFTIREAANELNIFDSLESTINALNGSSTTGVAKLTVERGLTEIDSIMNNLQAARTAVGETLNRMEGIESRNSALKLAAENERSTAEDLDMVEAISRFQNQQTGYDAALKSYAMVQRMSLLNYLNP